MNVKKHLLECAVLAQAVLLFLIVWLLPPADESSFHRGFLLLTAFICSTILIFVIRSHFFARILFRRRASGILQTKQRLERQHNALQLITRNSSIHHGELDQALREISEIAVATLGGMRASIWLFSQDASELRCVDMFDTRTQAHSSGQCYSVSDYPRYFDALRKTRVLAIDDVSEDLRIIEFDQKHLEGIHSMIDAPVHSNGVLVGAISLAHAARGRGWAADEQNFVASVADMIALVLEVRKRRGIEEDLRRKSLAIESSMDGMAILDEHQVFTYINQAHAHVYGYEDADELIGKSWRILYSPEEAERFERELLPRFISHGTLRTEATGRRKNGSQFPQEVCLTAIPNGGLICTVRDITARKRVESRVLQSERFLRTVIDCDPSLIFVKDARGKFTLVNQAVADMYGTSVENLIGKGDSDFNSNPEEVSHFRQDDQRVIESLEEVLIPEERITSARGDIHYLQTIKRPLRVGPDGAVHLLGVATDITQTRHLHNQLVQSQKMEAIGQLAGGIAHDFNNLLTGILGYTDLMRNSAHDEAEVRRAAAMIGGAAARAAGLTEKLLGFARKGKNQNIPVDLHETIRDSLSILARTVEKNIMIVELLDAQTPYVLGDPVQMEQIVLNLAINARDAMALQWKGSPRMGKLTISTREVNVRSGDPLALTVREGNFLRISVQDTGCGIPSEIRDKIFEPFFTTKEAGRGTGMGLAMVYGIVKNHGGAIIVESTVGEGSSFSVYLPLFQGTRQMEPAPEQGVPVSGNGRILVVDDHHVIREVTKELLTSLGYEVITVEDGVEAIRFYEEQHPVIDLVILDMVMPRMGARDCFRALRAIDPGVRVVLSTGYGNNNAVQEVMNEGLLGFIQKPYQLHHLSEVVARALRSRVSSTDSVEAAAGRPEESAEPRELSPDKSPVLSTIPRNSASLDAI